MDEERFLELFGKQHPFQIFTVPKCVPRGKEPKAAKAARLTKRQKEVLEQIPSDRWLPIDVIKQIDGWIGYRRIEKLQSAGFVATVSVEDEELFNSSPEERLLWLIFNKTPSKTYVRRVVIPEREEFLRWRNSKQHWHFLEAIELQP